MTRFTPRLWRLEKYTTTLLSLARQGGLGKVARDSD